MTLKTADQTADNASWRTFIKGVIAAGAAAARAGQLAVAGATALRDNAYKIPLMRNLVTRAIRGATGPVTT